MTAKRLCVVFTGAPGCGKGTQARILCQKKRICHLSTGEMLRAEISKETALGLELKKALDDGGFAPDELIIRMVEQRIGEQDCQGGFLLDGFPRTLPQAEILGDMLAGIKQNLNAVIEIQVPDEIIMERILGRYSCMECGKGYHDKFLKPKIYGVCDECGGTEFSRRRDDNRMTVHNRLVNFRALTYPTIPYFEEKGLLRCVDGTGTIDAVANKIEKVLGLRE